MRSGWRLIMALVLAFQVVVPGPALSQSLNVLPPIQAPRAVVSPPSRLPRAKSAQMPRALIIRPPILNAPNVLPLFRAPRIAATPPATQHRITAGP